MQGFPMDMSLGVFKLFLTTIAKKTLKKAWRTCTSWANEAGVLLAHVAFISSSYAMEF